MATTKVGGGVVDLNSENTAFQMPVGSSLFTGTPVAGMIRNNSSLANNDATTAFEYYDGTQWLGMSTAPLPKMDFLVVAGGGAAGNTTRTTSNGGGGGAGGYRTSYGTGNISGGNSPVESQITVSAGATYTVTVGAGTPLNVTGNNSSIIGGGVSIESIRGGMGMNQFDGGLQSGGSGGGASGTSGGAGGTAGQGMSGGNGTKSGCGAGGGGASANGSNNGPSNNQGGAGGNGMASSITGSSLAYAGGGGGASFTGSAPGGTGGGGASGNGYGGYGTAGAANTGGGGGGAPSKNQGAGGGSGVVILRMATSTYSGTTTGSPTVTTDGTDTILIYNGSGSYTA